MLLLLSKRSPTCSRFSLLTFYFLSRPPRCSYSRLKTEVETASRPSRTSWWLLSLVDRHRGAALRSYPTAGCSTERSPQPPLLLRSLLRNGTSAVPLRRLAQKGKLFALLEKVPLVPSPLERTSRFGFFFLFPQKKEDDERSATTVEWREKESRPPSARKGVQWGGFCELGKTAESNGDI